MKILLDENLPRKLKIGFAAEHEILRSARKVGTVGKTANC